jgi:hypothetical protein
MNANPSSPFSFRLTVKRFFLGSFSNYLSHHCPCNVMIVKDKDAESAAKIAASAADGGADKTA